MNPRLKASSRRDWLQHQGVLLLTLTAPQWVHGASIVAVRVWPAADYTRVTLESDEALVARHFVTNDPPRLVIDIDGLELNPQLRELTAKVSSNDPNIARLRLGQSQPRVVRMVFDLRQASRPQVFSLAPIPPYRHRTVFDLYPAEAPDPLALLIKDLDRSGPLPQATRPSLGAATQSSGPTGPIASETATRAQAAASSVDDALGEFMGRVDAPRSAGASAAAPANTASTPADPATAATKTPAGSATGTATGTAKGSATGATTGSAPGTSTAAAPGFPPTSRSTAGAPPSTAQSKAAVVNRLFIVAIDPGHGGEDPGAIGPTGLREKDVVLAIGRQLAERINAQPGMRAMLTRDDDYFVPLGERVRKARRVQADLFVSIHADAFTKPTAAGASVFALSEGGATSTMARWMAQKENAADAVGGINVAAKDTHVLSALLDMSTTAQIRDSLRLAGEVLGNIGRIGRLHKAQVEQASFAVLKAPDIPSILVETAFISNPEEEAKLRDEGYRTQLVNALQSGISRYVAKNPPLSRNRMV